VLILEKGENYANEQYRSDETSLADRFLYPGNSELRTVITKTNPQGVAHDLGWSANCVGGGTVHMGGFMYRFAPEDFRSVSEFGPHEQACDWPFSYEDYEPWYERAENELGISGDANSEREANARLKPYLLPKLQEHPEVDRIDAALRRLNWRSITTPRAVNSIEHDGRPACIYCDACAGYGCRIGAKNSVQSGILRRALATGRVKLITSARVVQLVADAQRVTHVQYVDRQGSSHNVASRFVSLSASAIESARLLLLSANSFHPKGLGNACHQVGQNLQFHAVTSGAARFPTSEPSASELPFLGRTITEYRQFKPQVFNRVDLMGKGGLIRLDMHSHKPVQSYRMAQALSDVPLFGQNLRAVMSKQRHQSQMIGFEAFHDFFPNSGTYMALDENRTDQLGLPVARISLDYPKHQIALGNFLVSKAKQLFDEMGPNDLVIDSVGGVSSHLAQGSCRFGNSPERAVLDRDCRVHGMQNLFVVDGSFMPTSGSAPPTLTILANSFRVADVLVKRFL
jgi:choline dehydrogenase-like flavoprotein